MKAYQLVISQKTIEENSDYFFRIDFKEVISMTHSLSEKEFISSLTNIFKKFNEDIQCILETLKNENLNLELKSEPVIWQDYYKEFIISVKGELHEITDTALMIETLEKCKLSLLKSSIFLQLINLLHK